MILKLIEAGGFAGLKKTAAEDISAYPDAVKEAVKKAFADPPPPAPLTRERDKEQHYLELEGKVVPVNAIKPVKELQDLIKKMQKNLAP